MEKHTQEKHSVTRVRHPLKLRLITVRKTERIAPHMLRVTFAGESLQDFVSASHDDHVKLFFPAPGQTVPSLPSLSETGPEYPEGAIRPSMRDYTPSSYDPVAGELVIDFALHGDGPAASWAEQAAPGQVIGAGGPRGSFVVSDDFDWYLLIGDETALPAIGRRLAELPVGARAIVIAEVADADEEIALPSEAEVSLTWLHRNGEPAGFPQRLEGAVRALALPAGEGYVWAAAELSVIGAIRKVLVDEHGINKKRIRAASYWKHGAVAHHSALED
ncbi:siderophore-interacting protein [Jeongeupia naejangsanensis]|uniref:Siderophore-interacting protein n=1 Tax=Jeongeupia naejangsanensis TaxID=613195 RepID=A0ABS2BHC3_9NEIS|nr:siderophore-interacting protein [Jeongeupia naejangsanensis]MBM3115018.1 siderophore-interacting protein [Jeongeupia naejangsanensis]